MHILPNGQNIQFIVPPPRAQERTTSPHEHLLFENHPPRQQAKEPELKTLPKDVAPHLNRHQRRVQLAALKAKAKAEGKNAALKAMLAQAKEKCDE